MRYPNVEVDWSRGTEFLDKELQKVVRDAELGRRHADKLVKVWARDGSEAWVLIHVEVQGEAEAAFTERMYVYHYRLYDRYKMDIVSLGVLADTTETFRANAFRWARWGCEVAFRFPTVKLLDWRARWPELEASDNPFALVVMAQLQANAGGGSEERKAAKLRLVRLLYERGYSRADILELFRIIDWMIQLPDALKQEFLTAVYEIEAAKKMPYPRWPHRVSVRQGEGAVSSTSGIATNKFAAPYRKAVVRPLRGAWRFHERKRYGRFGHKRRASCGPKTASRPDIRCPYGGAGN